VEGGIITYQSLNLRGGQLPVTISFDMTTITANVASHELTTSIIKLTGSVSWFGGSGPARTLSCMTLTFGNNYTVWPCDVAEPKDKSGGQETVKKSNR
jgi:hypothetical protein